MNKVWVLESGYRDEPNIIAIFCKLPSAQALAQACAAHKWHNPPIGLSATTWAEVLQDGESEARDVYLPWRVCGTACKDWPWLAVYEVQDGI